MLLGRGKSRRTTDPLARGIMVVYHAGKIFTRNRLKYGFPNSGRENSFNERRKQLL